jgi:ribosome-associated protein
VTAARIPVTAALSLDPAELAVSFIRAGGPGGQNVNKVSSAVQLRFDAARSPSLPAAVRARLIRLAGRRATKAGVIVLTAHEHRSQERNRAEALSRLVALIARAAVAPKARVATKATRGAHERRLKSKKRRGGVKAARRIAAWDGD